MAETITVKIGENNFSVALNDSKIGRMILEKLPLTAKASTWGEEIYFRIPVKEQLEKGVTEVKKGDVGYWPDGACFCIFFGPTPGSREGKIIPASAVEIIGKLLEPNYAALKSVADGEKIELTKTRPTEDRGVSNS